MLQVFAFRDQAIQSYKLGMKMLEIKGSFCMASRIERNQARVECLIYSRGSVWSGVRVGLFAIVGSAFG